MDYYKGPIDAIFGPLANEAVRCFQQDIRPDATGSLTTDHIDRLHLNEPPTAPTLDMMLWGRMYKPDVAILQISTDVPPDCK